MQVDDFYSTRPGFECDYKQCGGNSWTVHPWMETTEVSVKYCCVELIELCG